MVFSSPIFLFIFMPSCIVIYYLFSIFKNVHIKNTVLLVFSLIFYYYGSPTFFPILLISITINFVVCLLMAKTRNRNNKRVYLTIIVILNILLLFVYKYLNLFTDLITGGRFVTDIVLPIGISFYTFQVLSYDIDVYRGDVAPLKFYPDFVLYAMFFPQLIAGPIVRYKQIQVELYKRKSSFQNFTEGIYLFMIGFAKKIIFANSLGLVADYGFYNFKTEHMGLWFSSLTLICYSIQLYLDFWAYSDMAIGLGRIFGFNFPKNFDHPFTSSSIAEFWRRWHISLTSFFRDYVYIPLGGSRKGFARTIINTFIIFGLSGFWHGASLNFLFWGIYFAIMIIVERMMKYPLMIIPKTIKTIFVFIVWCISMLLFKLDKFSDIIIFVSNSFKPMSISHEMRGFINNVYNYYFMFTFSISLLYLTRFFDKAKKWLENRHLGILCDIVVCALFIYSCIIMLTDGFNPFLYFRF